MGHDCQDLVANRWRFDAVIGRAGVAGVNNLRRPQTTLHHCVLTTKQFKAEPSAIEVADARSIDIFIPIPRFLATKSDETRVSVWYSRAIGTLAKHGQRAAVNARLA